MLCFFIGHRDASSSLMPQLESAVKKHITDYGVTDFVVGQYGAFDRMAARAVIEAKKVSKTCTNLPVGDSQSLYRDDNTGRDFPKSPLPTSLHTLFALAHKRSSQCASHRLGRSLRYICLLSDHLASDECSLPHWLYVSFRRFSYHKHLGFM